MAKKINHIGFKGAERKVESEGYPAASAGRIIGYGKAHASASAKAKNPRLGKVGGHKRGR